MATRKSPTPADKEKKPTTRKAPARKTVQSAAAPAADSFVTKHLPTHEDVALLAVQFWNERGCPYGSPEVDWFRAEAKLHAA